jgi:hypothetical protein
MKEMSVPVWWQSDELSRLGKLIIRYMGETSVTFERLEIYKGRLMTASLAHDD